MAEEEESSLKYFKKLMKYLFSHVGLFVLVCAYCVGGAFLFIHIEGTDEEKNLEQGMNRSQQIETERQQLANDLWMHKWSKQFNETVEKLLNDYHANVTKAIENYSYKGKAINSTSELEYGWSFPSALLFTVTIVTTIGYKINHAYMNWGRLFLGYGHVSPVSEIGQIAVILYSLLGIPLMLMFLANIGDAMANFFRTAYGKGCCYFCYKQRKRNYEVNNKRQQRVRDSGDGPKSAWDEGYENEARTRKDDDWSVDQDAEHGDKAQKKQDWNEDVKTDPMDDAEDDVINVPISLTLVIIAAYVFIGAVIFATWNSWTWITGAYFSFVTLSTIGFGDLVPGWSEVGTTEGKIKLAVSSLYIVMGLAVLSMSFNLMMEEMIAKFKWLGRKLGIIDSSSPSNIRSTDDKEPLVQAEESPDTTTNRPAQDAP